MVRGGGGRAGGGGGRGEDNRRDVEFLRHWRSIDRETEERLSTEFRRKFVLLDLDGLSPRGRKRLVDFARSSFFREIITGHRGHIGHREILNARGS